MKPKAPNEHEDGMLEYMEDIIGELEGISAIDFVVYYWIISMCDLFLARSFSYAIFLLRNPFLFTKPTCKLEAKKALINRLRHKRVQTADRGASY